MWTIFRLLSKLQKGAFKNSLLTEKKDYTINSQIILPKYNEMISDAAETVT